MRIAIVFGVLVLLVAGCSSHHKPRAEPKQPRVTYVAKIVPVPGCELSPFPTQGEIQRWLRRCGRP